MEYLVGWPRIEIADKMMDWPQLKLVAAKPERSTVPGEELVWIEDKILQLQDKKRLLAKELIADDTTFVKSLTREDVEYLFS